jgi:hypothetical protein
MEAVSLPVELRDGWLSFESEHGKRRFAPIPPDWEFLSEAALCRLLLSAVPDPKAAEQAGPPPPGPYAGG